MNKIKGKVIITSTPKSSSTKKWLSEWIELIKKENLKKIRLEKLERIIDNE